MVNKLILFGLFCMLLKATGAKGDDPHFDDTPLNIYVDVDKEIDGFINLTKINDGKQQLMEEALESLSVKVTRLNQKVNELSNQLAKSQEVAKRPAERACEQIRNDMRSIGVTNIIGTPYYSFQLYDDNGNAQICMGALIDKRFVLILADCLPESNRMQIGLPYSPKAKIVKEIHVHANFSKSTTRSNIAIIELDSDLDYNTVLYPVCLYTSPLNPKDKLIHAHVKAQFVPNSECEKNYNLNLPQFEACAKDLQNILTLDGEPIFVEKKEFPKFQLFGMILMKANNYKPYCIAKVFEHLEFIENIVWPNYRK